MNSLKLWLTLRVHGRKAYEDLIDRQLKLAASFARWIKASNDFELAVPQTLPIVTFRLKSSRTRPATTGGGSQQHRGRSHSRWPPLDFGHAGQGRKRTAHDGHQLSDRRASLAGVAECFNQGVQKLNFADHKPTGHEPRKGTKDGGMSSNVQRTRLRILETAGRGIRQYTRIAALSGLSFFTVRANNRQRYRSVPSASWMLGR